MYLARVIRLILALATLLTPVFAGPAPLIPESRLQPHRLSLAPGPLPTSRALQILSRDEPAPNVEVVDLDNLLDNYSDLISCTPKQRVGIKTLFHDLHVISTLALYAAKDGLIENSAVNFTLFGKDVTLDPSMADALSDRWFGTLKFDNYEQRNNLIRDIFLRVEHFHTNTNYSTLHFDCQTPLGFCRGESDHYNDIGLSVTETNSHVVNICPYAWTGLSLEHMLRTQKSLSDMPKLPAAYPIFYTFVERALREEMPRLRNVFIGCKWVQDIVPVESGNNGFGHARSIAKVCPLAAGHNPDNWIGFAFEVAVTLFNGELPFHDEGLESTRQR